jgi:hypothetical protein
MFKIFQRKLPIMMSKVKKKTTEKLKKKIKEVKALRLEAVVANLSCI